MPFQILHNDIIYMGTDAIVNMANSNLLVGGSVCGAILKSASQYKLQKECKLLVPCQVSHAVIIKGYSLKVKYIIYAVDLYTKREIQMKQHILKVPMKIY